MIQGRLRNLRKKKGISQKEIARILSIDISSYCRKENGKSKIHDDEWEKLATILNVSADEIKEKENSGMVYDDNPTSSTNSGNYNQYFNLPNSILENLHDYISILKHENESLKAELEKLKYK
ncbi:transcriptional regulator with XRE-family HTH domain [Chryseobacterium sp. SORGH_AS 447]|uniref:helix-turn-helix domain-containing protein n=1 Tax=Chryseobacterium sp. SORGH_AS_0447 TaxID=3041769 RepID=UPI00278AC14B|nr:helix-turn-helix transcriptional regulator [Chryseobacterium sp. SORGH_AS_0447]MDQ1160442.1 transcriptional regulator with XRE-family HTH domain [Chryseobacterium sp. SORGH_AS_0447]